MTAVQYPRSFDFSIGGVNGQTIHFVSGDLSLGAPEFRVAFRVVRGDLQTPNTCDVRIYNLKTDTVNAIARAEFTQISLLAGYPGTLGLIFTGVIKQKRVGRVDQKDSYVDLTAADGDEAYNFSVIAHALAAGQAKPQNMVEVFLQFMANASAQSQKITAGYGADGKSVQFPTAATQRARVLFGDMKEEIRTFMDNLKCTASFQDGAWTIVPKNAYIPVGEVPLISVATGLIGVPEVQANGLALRTLLNPQIKIGQLIKLDAAVINQFRYSLDFANYAQNELIKKQIAPSSDGLYYVMAVNHIGDSRGTEWYSDLLCLSINATVNPDALPNTLVFPDTDFIGEPNY